MSFFWLFPAVSFAGLLGANMLTLRAIRDAVRVSARTVPVDVVLGVSAGVISAMLYLLVQFGVSGDVAVEMPAEDYVPVTRS